MTLDRLQEIPAELLSIGPREIRRVLPHPTLIRVAGRRNPPLFLSVLLHGNETAGFFVLQALARTYAHSPPPRSLLIFVGNVDAVAAGVRRFDHQKDFNRVWAAGEGPEFELAAAVLSAARDAAPMASIDIHNNTGVNPFYACVNSLDSHHLNLAALFSRIAVLYRNPSTTQSMAFSRFCPAVTIECGRIGNPDGQARAFEFVNDVLHLEHIPDRAPPPRDLKLFETVGRVLIEPDCSFSFGDDEVDVSLRRDLETRNFAEMAVDEVWAESAAPKMPIRVVDEAGRDITDRYFRRLGRSIRLRQSVTPAMITLDRLVIRQDCLGYLMTPLSLTPA
jgi:succinylglutamate desuccinylase